MLLPHLLFPLLLVTNTVQALRKSEGQKVLLSNVQTLTLRLDQKTSHRRVSAVPQLKCIGGNAKGLYNVDIMRCKNQGSDYDSEDIQWTCTASLPSEFKLGSTDVVCEGYESADDPYVLKGSCGVEYRLLLTTIGEERYGRRAKSNAYDMDLGESPGSKLGAVLFGLVFVGVLGWIVYSALFGNRAGNGRNAGGGYPWGGGGGGGGGGFGRGDDPPPPYSRQAPPSGGKRYPSNFGANASSWRPGFWSGAAAGAAGAYLAGNRGQTQRPPSTGSWGWGGNDNGEGSSSGRTRPSSSSSSSFSSTRHQSSGFGSTGRR
ncbi:MAG: hypothetical protein Q9182_001678 [Xanthomendoza sp. 2 TL-2023]